MSKTYFERIEGVRKKTFEEALKSKSESKKVKVQLTAQEEDFAKKTLHLLSDPGFKEFLHYLAGIRAGLLSNPYEKSPHCKRDDFEYQIGFNEGFYKGVLFVTHDIDRIWKAFLVNIENEQGGKNEDEKSKTKS